MKIWLINPYGPVPSEGWRDYCYAMLAGALAGRGHEVVWWTSNFSHHFKTFRSKGWADISTPQGYTIRFVPGPGYGHNVSPGRIVRDLVFAARCWWRGRSLPRPDGIVFSENPLTLGFAGHRLARHFQCAAVHHQMDLWPELMVNAVPAQVRPYVNAALWPVYWQRRRMFRTLDAATGLAEPYLQVALREAPVLRERPHGVFYNGIDVAEFRALMAQPQRLPETVPPKAPGDLWAVFAGSLGPSYDIPALCEAARLLEASASRMHIVIAGDGPLRPMVEAAAARAGPQRRLHYLGKLKPEQLAPLYACCDIGLCAYTATSNVEMPDKIYDYTAAGLPVVNALQGEVSRVIDQHGIGLQYNAGQADHLLRQLRHLEEQPALRRRMANASHALGTEYDQHVQYGRMADTIELAVSRSKNMAA